MAGSGRQKGKAEQLEDTPSDPASELQKAMVNGKPKMNGTVGKVDNSIGKKENIFLFIPNVIGRSI